MGEVIAKYPEAEKIFFDQRELEALARIAKYHAENPERPIILFYGKGHRFEDYSGQYFQIERVEP